MVPNLPEKHNWKGTRIVQIAFELTGNGNHYSCLYFPYSIGYSSQNLEYARENIMYTAVVRMVTNCLHITGLAGHDTPAMVQSEKRDRAHKMSDFG